MSLSWLMMSSKEEVDPNALEREVESNEEEESWHDEDKFEEDDEDDRYGTWRTESDSFHLRWSRVRVSVHDRDCLPIHVGPPVDRDCLPVHAGRPGDRDRLPIDHTSNATFPFFLTTRTMADRYAEGTPQPDLDPEAWVDAVGGPRKGRVYGFGDSLDTTPV
ncbi:hypothetical protein Taro_055759, partial [Colocasia esculenta]|nr:hypothetical protein [Colocasia esculenta]